MQFFGHVGKSIGIFLWYIKRDVVLKEKSFHVLIVYAYDTLAAGVVNGGSWLVVRRGTWGGAATCATFWYLWYLAGLCWWWCLR